MTSTAKPVIGELLRSLVSRVLTRQSSGPGESGVPSEDDIERATRRAARLLDSSLSAAPSLQSQDVLVRSVIMRLIRDGRHSDATRVAQLAAAMKFEPAFDDQQSWNVMYLLAALTDTSSGSSSTAREPSPGDSSSKSKEDTAPEKQTVRNTSASFPRDQQDESAETIPRSAFEAPRNDSREDASSCEMVSDDVSDDDSSGNEDIYDSDGNLTGTAGNAPVNATSGIAPGSNDAGERQHGMPVGMLETDLNSSTSSTTPRATEVMLVRDVMLVVQGESGYILRFNWPQHDCSDQSDAEVSARDSPSSHPVNGILSSRNEHFHVENAVHIARERAVQPPTVNEMRRSPENDRMSIEFVHPPGKQFAISSSTVHIVHYIAELGFLFGVIRRRLDSVNQNSGLVSTSFCNAVDCEMESYYRSLATFQTGPDIDDDDVPSLRTVFVWAENEKPRLRWLARLCDETSTLHGGQILSHLRSYRKSYVSDDIKGMLSRIISRTAAPLDLMLIRWLTEGVLADPHNEFYVMEDPKVAAAAHAATAALGGGEITDRFIVGGPNSASSASNRVWWGLFKVRRDMIPGFQSPAVVENTLVAGKSIAFLRRCCFDSVWVDQVHAPAMSSFLSERSRDRSSHTPLCSNVGGGTYGVGGALLDQDPRMGKSHVAGLVNYAVRSASHRLKDLFFAKFDLNHHFAAIKNYLLLSQGDFAQALMESLAPMLDGDGRILRNNITGLLDAALRGCSSFNSGTDGDIAERLDVQILPHGANDTVGWDVFSLTYRVEDAPLNTVFSARVMDSYLQIFRFLWRLKRMDYILGAAYVELRELDCQLRRFCRSSRKLRNKPPVSKEDHMTLPDGNSTSSTLVHHALFTRMKMAHVVQNMQYYCMFEVLEGNWKILLDEMSKAENIDSLIRAHTRYLGTIMDRALLSDRGREVARTLDGVLNTVIEFRNLQGEICPINADADMSHLKASALLGKICNLEKKFDQLFLQFLVGLKRHSVEVGSFTYLLFRLDYNSFYASRDSATNRDIVATDEILDGLRSAKSTPELDMEGKVENVAYLKGTVSIEESR